VEMHLDDLVESIHQVRSNRIGPYLDHNRQQICEKCVFLHSSVCPCPMDYLAVLVVQAVETVDQRRAASRGAVRIKGGVAQAGENVDKERNDRFAPAIDVEEVRRVYQEATGTWTGCDWPTVYGITRLNLQRWSAAQARAMALTLQSEDWLRAADWFGRIELQAQLPEKKAAEAMEAASEGHWRDALVSAEWAWSLEFSTGRPLRHGPPLAWQRLRDTIEAGYLAHEVADVSGGDITS
jgi:hypothetical protein